MIFLWTLVLAQSPSPSPTVLKAPPESGLEVAGAIIRAWPSPLRYRLPDHPGGKGL